MSFTPPRFSLCAASPDAAEASFTINQPPGPRAELLFTCSTTSAGPVTATVRARVITAPRSSLTVS